MSVGPKKTVLWVYDEGRAYPEPQVQHVRAYLHVDVIPVSSTFQAVNILRLCEPSTFSFVVTSLVRKEFGSVINNAGISLIAAVRSFDPTIPIALFSVLAYSKMMAGALPQAYAAAGGAPGEGLFEVVENTNSLINFLARHGAPRVLASHDTKLPSTGDKVASDSGTEYEIGQRIGEGSYAWVFECRDVFGQQFVAKVQKPERAKQIVEDDWKKEQAFLKSLNHPNVIILFESFIHNNLYYYIMERAECNLRSWMKSNVISHDQIVDVAAQLLSGLAHIHRNRIIHRDLQVDNVLVSHNSEGGIIVKISDFGISKLLHSTDTSTVGTTGRPIDLPPEVLSTGTSTFLSDIYQLGLILYQLYTGHHPITDKPVCESDAAEASSVPPQHQYDAISAGQPASRAEQIGDGFGSCIARMLHVSPAMRYQTPTEAWKDIRLRTMKNHLQSSYMSMHGSHSPALNHSHSGIPMLHHSQQVQPTFLAHSHNPHVHGHGHQSMQFGQHAAMAGGLALHQQQTMFSAATSSANSSPAPSPIRDLRAAQQHLYSDDDDDEEEEEELLSSPLQEELPDAQ